MKSAMDERASARLRDPVEARTSAARALEPYVQTTRARTRNITHNVFVVFFTTQRIRSVHDGIGRGNVAWRMMDQFQF